MKIQLLPLTFSARTLIYFLSFSILPFLLLFSVYREPNDEGIHYDDGIGEYLRQDNDSLAYCLKPYIDNYSFSLFDTYTTDVNRMMYIFINISEKSSIT
jgi:hypothetical protein